MGIAVLGQVNSCRGTTRVPARYGDGMLQSAMAPAGQVQDMAASRVTGYIWSKPPHGHPITESMRSDEPPCCQSQDSRFI